MACNIQINSITNALVTWDPIGEIDGIADGELSVDIAPSDDSSNTMKVSSDGNYGTISGNSKTNGEVTIKIHPGSPFVSILTDLWNRDKFSRGTMNVVDVDTGEVFQLLCAVLKNVPNMGRGSETPDSYDFVFLYSKSIYTPPAGTISRQVQ